VDGLNATVAAAGCAAKGGVARSFVVAASIDANSYLARRRQRECRRGLERFGDLSIAVVQPVAIAATS
jgi:hypothetical protein